MVPDYTNADLEALDNLDAKLSQIRDGVRGVATEFHTGLFLWGEGGTSKSYTVLETLKNLKTDYVYHNSRITGRGLFDLLQRSPTSVHFIEDAETMLDDKKTPGVIRSACWSQSKKKPMERRVTWTAFKTELAFVFTGSLIVISNDNLADDAQLRAIRSRVKVMHLDITAAEIKALMKRICMGGHEYGPDYLTADECWEVAAFIIESLEKLNRNLDLRLLMNGFKDHLQYKTGNSENHWKVLLEGRMKEQVMYINRASQKAQEHRVAMDIHALKVPIAKKLDMWKQKTDLDKSSYYRALRRK